MGGLVSALVFIMANINTEELSKKQIDITRVWDSYEYWAQKYLDRPIFKGTPVTGKMLRDAAETTYNQTGTYVPIDLALTQGQLETSFGLVGRKNKKTNPYNVGEYDKETVMTFQTVEEGIGAYYNLIANNYLKGKTAEDLKSNFVNTQGLRYASNPNYEKLIKQQTAYIQKWAKDVAKEKTKGSKNGGNDWASNSDGDL